MNRYKEKVENIMAWIDPFGFKFKPTVKIDIDTTQTSKFHR